MNRKQALREHWRKQLAEFCSLQTACGSAEKFRRLLQSCGLVHDLIPTNKARADGFVGKRSSGREYWIHDKLRSLIKPKPVQLKEQTQRKERQRFALTFGEVYGEYLKQIPPPPEGRLTYFKNDPEVVEGVKRILGL